MHFWTVLHTQTIMRGAGQWFLMQAQNAAMLHLASQGITTNKPLKGLDGGYLQRVAIKGRPCKDTIGACILSPCKLLMMQRGPCLESLYPSVCIPHLSMYACAEILHVKFVQCERIS